MIIHKRHFAHFVTHYSGQKKITQGDPAGRRRWKSYEREFHQNPQVFRLLHEGFRQKQGRHCNRGGFIQMFVFKQNIDQSYVRNEMTMHFDFHPKYAISFLCHKAECHSHFFLLSLLIFLPSNLALNPFPLSPFKSCKICHLQSWFNFEPNF